MLRQSLAIILAAVMVFGLSTSGQAESMPDCPFMVVPTRPLRFRNEIFIPQSLTEDAIQLSDYNGYSMSNIFYGYSSIFDTDLNMIANTKCTNGQFWFEDGKLSSLTQLESQTSTVMPATMLEREGKVTVFDRDILVCPFDNFYCTKSEASFSFFALDTGQKLCTLPVKPGSGVISIGNRFAIIANTAEGNRIINIDSGKTVFEYKEHTLNYGDGICITWNSLYDANTGKSFKLESFGIKDVYLTRIRKNSIDFYESRTNINFPAKSTLSVWKFSRKDSTVKEMKVVAQNMKYPELLDSFDDNVLIKDYQTGTLKLCDTTTGKAFWSLDAKEEIGTDSVSFARIINTNPKKAILWGMEWISIVNMESGRFEKKIPKYNYDNQTGEVFQNGNRFLSVKYPTKHEVGTRLFIYDKDLKPIEIDVPYKKQNYLWSVWKNMIVFWARIDMGEDNPTIIKYFFYDMDTSSFMPEKSINVELGTTDKILVSGKFLLNCFGLRQSLVDLETGKKVAVDSNPRHVCSGGFLSATDGVVYACLNFDNNRYSVVYAFDSTNLEKYGQSLKLKPADRIDFATPDNVVCSSDRQASMSISDCNGNTTELAGKPIMLYGRKLYFRASGKVMSVDLDTMKEQLVNERCYPKWHATRIGNNIFDGNHVYDENFDIRQMNVKTSVKFVYEGRIFGQSNSNGLLVELAPSPSFRINYRESGKIEISHTRTDGQGKDLEGFLIIYGINDPDEQSAYHNLDKVEFGGIKQGETKIVEFDQAKLESRNYVCVDVFANGVYDYRLDMMQKNDYPQYYGYVYDSEKIMTVTGKSFKRQPNVSR